MTPRERYAFHRRNGQCVTCGLVAVKGHARCRRCKRRLTRTYRRESPERRAKRRANDRAWQAARAATPAGRARAAAARVRRKHRDVCVDCRRAPAPDRIRCPRHLRRARDRQRKRRADAQKNRL